MNFLTPFLVEAKELFMTGEYDIENEGCMPLVKFMHWIDELNEDNHDSDISIDICQFY